MSVICTAPPVNEGRDSAARAVPVLGAGSALLAYVGLFAGFLLLGFAAQSRDVIVGLWLTEGLAIALPAIIVLRAANVAPGPYLGFRLPRKRWLLIALIAGLANQPVVSLLEQVAHSLLPAAWVADFDAKNQMLDGIFASHAGAMIATVAIAAPLGEELFFRGFAQTALARTLGAGTAALICAALFSLLHLDPVGFLGLMEIGLLLAVLRHASGSLWPAVLAHAVNNGVAAAAFVAGMQDPSSSPPTWFLGLGAILLLAFAALAVRLLRAPPGAPSPELRWSAKAAEPDRFRLLRAWPLLLLWALAVGAGTKQSLQLLRPAKHAPQQLLQQRREEPVP